MGDTPSKEQSMNYAKGYGDFSLSIKGDVVGFIAGVIIGIVIGWAIIKSSKKSPAPHRTVFFKRTVLEHGAKAAGYKNADYTKHKESLRKVAQALSEAMQQMEAQYNNCNNIDTKLKQQEAELEGLSKIESELNNQIQKLCKIQNSFDNCGGYGWEAMVS
ncbi:hypothetical protein RFI_27522 [Reticulomyxa filosa]|uniref:Uncharacterized protein n=1 Tax=Reticulomyxa filosa TaxID=46433 RepID=X6M8Q9_RETFI|nr:hypothetical protein RFI_27522 [Reticulomyxa filosa]|eukprot:ETO09857.1 hypothetical protein RFI_27522 [Reticulomyxa filosa]